MRVLISDVTVNDLTRGATDAGVQEVARFVNLTVVKALRREMPGMVVSSAYRSKSKQLQLWLAYKAGRGPRAAPPGASAHHYGLIRPGVRKWALDLKIEGKDPHAWIGQLVAALMKHGVKFHIAATERTWVHIEGVWGGGEPMNKRLIKHW